ncbi:MAG: V-type ATP synthase subunit D [Candidatus Latescibacterota bacterium]|nr:MAG: V-type ATP synthase subunit D [Candidatus Latescibacterota bacterium]
MRIKVNPNRMMLIRLRRRLELARRGHRLLKNKQEKLMQNFFSLVRETTELRGRVERNLMEASVHYLDARAATGRHELEDALELTTKAGELSVELRHEMNVTSPEFSFAVPPGDPAYRLSGATSAELDAAYRMLVESFPALLDLVGRENALFRMAEELEKTRRRVNALEYVLLPDLAAAIRSIEDKLGEQERSNQIRLMKIKDMVKGRNESV